MESLYYFFPETTLFLTFLTGAVILGLTPGADMALVATTAVSRGWKAGWAASAGIFTGCFVHILFAVFGLSALLMASETAFTVVKYAGAGYLLYLAWQALRNNEPVLAPKKQAAKKDGSYFGAFRKGFLVNVLNPKVGMFFLAFLPQFTDPEKGSLGLQIFILGVIFNCIGTMANLGVSVAAEKSLKQLSTKPLAWKIGKWITASLFSALALRLAFSEQK